MNHLTTRKVTATPGAGRGALARWAREPQRRRLQGRPRSPGHRAAWKRKQLRSRLRRAAAPRKERQHAASEASPSRQLGAACGLRRPCPILSRVKANKRPAPTFNGTRHPRLDVQKVRPTTNATSALLTLAVHLRAHRTSGSARRYGPASGVLGGVGAAPHLATRTFLGLRRLWVQSCSTAVCKPEDPWRASQRRRTSTLWFLIRQISRNEEITQCR